LFGLIPYLKKVWEGPTQNYTYAQKIYPGPLKQWFEDAVMQYENYVSAWEEEGSSNVR
jgi:hypothetical protein